MVSYTELDLDTLAEWPLWNQILIILLFIGVLQAIGYWLYFQPESEQMNTLHQREKSLKSAVRMKANAVATLPILRAELETLSERHETFSRQFPDQKELATMLVSINELGRKNALTFTQMEWGQKQAQPFVYRLPLHFELIGDYHNIGDFCQAIAELPHIINLEDIEWRRVSQESRTLHFRVRAYTYQLNTEVENES